ncbi:DNA-binding NarL/FixJ family response regulator [Cupriavidus metallidurans]|jgi:DNA-binding NarL/FixJ family response regulator|uniref:Two component transcriptional regulator, LuxR family n=1 Tax=Cupriavidus metallidurans (strain ATCC 43123 / DSM 2839 / NBRC 102507 / CH34) TaxID=266264 RepID=Q1LCV2_CUPMC|nr:response regulator transcription factor [Cupriavidus metallidurans]ABF12024.1 two component transcriptional regulator, LuxR family [Cupriavidus metallidurans CH34]AVA34296.1 DNA-binding response regulator [Cupriavidus metallidurans]KWW32898.1 Oxygen regulatory protein NreC [Cupriavidus metallidurans]MDE4922051.1 response regulator transcription factor [Cupriavidus metallidurans]QGS32704.1 response regulator [Cupriavidus metallidurans]
MPLRTLAADLTLPAPALLVEDDPLVSRRLENLLQQLGYAPDALVLAASLAEARARVTDQPVALALVDLGLPDGSGIDLIAELRAADPGLGILVISAWSTQDAILAALRAGATGYVVKERDDLEVALALRSVLRGGAPIDPFIARRIIEELHPGPSESANAQTPEPSTERLSPREHQILRLVADGLGNREIAERLFLSRYTVECHIKHIYRKLAVSSRTRAINAARSRGLLG